MADIADLIAEILDTPKLKNTAEKLREEYRDEPILRTAAQMVKQLPQPLADAKKIALSPSQNRTFLPHGGNAIVANLL